MTGYTGFSGATAEQSGNYVVLHFEVPDVEGVTIKAGLINGDNPLSTLDEDGICIFRIKDVNTQAIKVEVTKTGCEDVVKVIKLTGLTVEEA